MSRSDVKLSAASVEVKKDDILSPATSVSKSASVSKLISSVSKIALVSKLAAPSKSKEVPLKEPLRPR